MQRRELAVDHDDAVFCQCDRDVPALALEHVDVVAEVGGLDLDLGEIDWRRGRRWCLLLRNRNSGEQHRGCERRQSRSNQEKSPQ